MPESTRTVLSAASVLGRDFGGEGEVLESVSALRGVSLVAALQPAAQGRIIQADPERQGRYRFVHALVQEVLYADLPEEVRRAGHARAAAALEGLPREARLARIEELAFHASAARQDRASRRRASILCEEAGRRASSALAYEDAARWFARATDLESEAGALEEPAPADAEAGGDRARTASLLFAHADALARTPRAAEARQRVPRDSLWRASVALGAQAAATLGDVGVARAASELLRPFRGINVVQGVPVAWGATDHYLGIALAAAGEADEAMAHLERAVELHGRWGAMALRTASQAELANLLRRRGRARDRPRVAGIEAQVRAEASRLGIARPLLTRDRHGPVRPAERGRGGYPLLTEREAKVLGLLSRGRANKEIADALGISVHTVERHLANLYAKLGARNRAEAAAFAVAAGFGKAS